MTQTQGYPGQDTIDDFFGDLGIELISEWNMNFETEEKNWVWNILQAVRWAITLRVFAYTTTTFKAVGGLYLWGNTIKTYSTESAVDPTDNDTTYVWLTSSNAIGSGIDGDGWPATEHIKLAEIDVDADGIITDIRDLRGQAFLRGALNILLDGGAAVEALPVFWDSPTPADNDEIRIPIYANNDADEKTEVARITIALTDVSDGAEVATVSLSRIVAGALTALGELVATTATQTLTNKTIDGDDNTVQDLSASALKVLTSYIAVPFMLKATLTAGNTVAVFNSDAPYKFEIIDAWSVAKSTDAGTWKLTDGSNDITDAVAVTGTDKTIDRAGTIDDTYNQIAASGSLSVVGDGSLADVDVYMLCVRVS